MNYESSAPSDAHTLIAPSATTEVELVDNQFPDITELTNPESSTMSKTKKEPAGKKRSESSDSDRSRLTTGDLLKLSEISVLITNYAPIIRRGITNQDHESETLRNRVSKSDLIDELRDVLRRIVISREDFIELLFLIYLCRFPKTPVEHILRMAKRGYSPIFDRNIRYLMSHRRYFGQLFIHGTRAYDLIAYRYGLDRAGTR